MRGKKNRGQKSEVRDPNWVRTFQPIVTGLKPIGLSSKAINSNAGKLFVDLALSKEGRS